MENKITRFFSSISMEIYLSHMVIFRVLEKLQLNTILGDGKLQYIMLVVMVIAVTSVFAVVMRKIIGMLEKGWNLMNRKREIY